MGYLPPDLEKKVKAKRVVTDASLELTYKCNLKCSICYITDEPQRELSLDEIKNLLDQLAGESCLFLTITGGEPFLRPDIFDILDYSTDRGFAVTLKTNGTLMNKDYAKRTAAAKPMVAHISLLAGGAELHDSITGVQGSFDRAVSAVRLLKDEGLQVLIMSTLTKGNIGEIEKIERLSKEIGADDFVFGSIIYPKNDGGKKPLRYRLDDDEIGCYYKFYNIGPVGAGLKPAPTSATTSTGLKPAPTSAPTDEEQEDDLSLTCGAGRTLINITPSGKVTPCLSLPMELGDVLEKPLREILGSANMKSVIDGIGLGNVEKCRDCDDRLICFRCPGLSYLEDGNACRASEEACRLTRIRNVGAGFKPAPT